MSSLEDLGHRRRLRPVGIWGLLALLAPAAPAHDMWIEPASFHAAPGAALGIGLRIGHADDVEPVRRNPPRIVRFTAIGPDGEIAVDGAPGADPAGVLRPAQPGLWRVVYQSNDAYSQLAAAPFEAYLEEEGLDDALEIRRRRGAQEAPGRELYSRSLKSLLAVGSISAATVDEPLGLPLELIVEADPLRLEPSRPVPLRLLRAGAPVDGALVDVRSLDVPSPRGDIAAVASERTNAEGRLGLRLSAGRWLAAVVVIEEVDDEDDEDARAEWRSIFSTLTFAVGEAPPR